MFINKKCYISSLIILCIEFIGFSICPPIEHQMDNSIPVTTSDPYKYFCMPYLPNSMYNLLRNESNFILFRTLRISSSNEEVNQYTWLVPDLQLLLALGWAEVTLINAIEETKRSRYECMPADANLKATLNHMMSTPSTDCHWLFGWQRLFYRPPHQLPPGSTANLMPYGPYLRGIGYADLWLLCDGDWTAYQDFRRSEEQFLHSSVWLSLPEISECSEGFTAFLYDANLLEQYGPMWAALMEGPLVRSVPDAGHGVWAVSRVFCNATFEFGAAYSAMQQRNPKWTLLNSVDLERAKQIHDVLIDKLAADFVH